MKKSLFSGSGVALVTPFCDGGVDMAALGRLLRRQMESGTDALIVLGTTGEPPTLSDAERDSVIARCVELAGGRVPVIVGAGTNDTARSADLAARARALGADGVLVVTPYYNKPSQEGLFRHFMTVAEKGALPLIMYNVPSRTGVSLAPETVARLSEHELIAGLKEASGDLVRLAETINMCGKKLSFYSGNDDQTLLVMALGGSGVISVAANLIPDVMHEMTAAALQGDFKRCRELQLKWLRLMRLLFVESNPAPVKTALDMMGLCRAGVRAPLCEMGAVNAGLLRRELENMGLA